MEILSTHNGTLLFWCRPGRIGSIALTTQWISNCKLLASLGVGWSDNHIRIWRAYYIRSAKLTLRWSFKWERCALNFDIFDKCRESLPIMAISLKSCWGNCIVAKCTREDLALFLCVNADYCSRLPGYLKSFKNVNTMMDNQIQMTSSSIEYSYRDPLQTFSGSREEGVLCFRWT